MFNRKTESNIKDDGRERIIAKIIDCHVKALLMTFTFKSLIAN